MPPRPIQRPGNDRFRLRRRLLKLALIALFGAVGLYNLFTGSWFITNVLFPLASDRIKYNVAADAVEISLLHGTIKVRNFRFGPGWEPIVLIPEAAADFSRRELLRGRLKLHSIFADSAEVVVCRNQAGYYNVNKMRNGPPPPDPPGPVVFPEQPDFRLEASDIRVTNGRFRLYYINNSGVNELNIDATGIDIAVDNFKNGGESKIKLTGGGKLSTYSLDLKNFHLDLDCTARFTDHLLPSFTLAEARISRLVGMAGGVDLSKRTIRANGEASGDNVLNALQVKYINVEIADSDGRNTGINVTGDLDFYPWHMRATADFSPIDDELFQYFHNYLGLALRRFTMYSENVFTLDYVTATLDGRMKLEKNGFDLHGDYRFTWNIPDDLVTLSDARMRLDSAEKTYAEFTMSAPLAVDFSSACTLLAPQPSLRLRLNRFDLARLNQYRSFPGFRFTSGMLTGDLTLTPDAALSSFRIDGWSIGEKLNLQIGNRYNYKDLSGNFSLSGALSAAGILDIGNFEAVLAQDSEQLLAVRLKDSRIDMHSGQAELNAGFSGLKEHLLAIQPLNTLLERLPRLEKILRGLSPLELTATVPIVYTPKDSTLKFGNSEAILYSREREFLKLNVEPNTLDFARRELQKELEARLTIRQLPLSLPFQWLPENYRPENLDGSLGAEVTIRTVPPNFERIVFNCGFSLRNMLLKDGEFSTDRLAADGTLELTLRHLSSIDGGKLSLKAQRDGLDVLSASFNFNAGNIWPEFCVDGSIAYFNSAIIDNADLHLRSPLTADGALRLTSSRNREFRYSGEFSASTMLPGKEKPHRISLDGALNLNGDPESITLAPSSLTVRGETEELGDFEVSGTIKLPENQRNSAYLELKADRLDAKTILALLEDREKDPTHEPLIDVGGIPFVIDANINHITWGEDINAQASGRIAGHNRKLLFERIFLRFNGAEIKVSGLLNGTEKRTAYSFQASADDAELATVLAPFMPAGLNNEFYAAMRRFELNISGDSLSPNGFWDSQQGRLDIDLARVRLPHTLGSTLIGRVVLLPFSILVNLNEILPLSLDRAMRLVEIVSLLRQFYDNTGAIEFNRGKVALKSEAGRIAIEQFELTGSPVKRFEFQGSFGAGSDRSLNLSSLVEIMGLLIPVKISGTLDAPEVNYAGMAADILSTNAANLVDSLNPLNLLPEKEK